MEDYEKCTLCGLCKVNCPTFQVLKNEGDSPRGKAILMKKECDDPIFFKCNLCGACKTSCPMGIDLGLKQHRAKLVEKDIQTDANKKMIENVRKYGNPFGDPDDDSDPDELYCC